MSSGDQKKWELLSAVWWRNKFLTGLAVAIPMAATLFVLRFLYKVISGVTEPVVIQVVTTYHEQLPGLVLIAGPRPDTFTIPGVALLLTILLIGLLGLLVTNVFGKKILGWLEYLMNRIPLVNVIYPLAKQVVDSIKAIGEAANGPVPGDSRQVVYLKYPDLNGYLIGFQTGRFSNQQGEEFVSVFIPTAPNPITGFVLIFKEEEVIESDLAMEDAWKLLVSAGFVTPLSKFPTPNKTTTARKVPASNDTRQTG